MSLSLGNVYDTATNQGADDGRQYIKAANLVGVPLQIIGAEVRPSFFDAKKEEAVYLFWQSDDLETLGAEDAPLYAVSFTGAKMVNTAKHLLMQTEAAGGEFPDIAPVMLVIDSSESGQWARQQFGRFPYKWEDVSEDGAEVEPEIERPATTGTKASRVATATATRKTAAPSAKRAMVHA